MYRLTFGLSLVAGRDRTALATETTRYQPLLKSGDRHFVKVNYEHVALVHYAAAEDKNAVESTKIVFPLGGIEG